MTDQNAAPLVVNAQYVKDLSFEAPNTPGIFAEMGRSAPEIPITIDVQVQQLQESVFEVSLHLNVESKLEGKVAFLVELVYAGVFTLNVPAEHVQPVLLVECPRLMFPFARAIIANVTKEGGFPPLMLQPLDFGALYNQRMAEAQAEAQAQQPQ